MILNNFFDNFINLFFALFLSFISVLLWLLFYYYFSKNFTISQVFLVKIFFFGILSAIIALILERFILDFYTPASYLNFIFFNNADTFSIKEALLLLISLFSLTALIEEVIKFLTLRMIIIKNNIFDQVVDGIKTGVVFGLGFGMVENFFYFFFYSKNYAFSEWMIILNLFLVRFLIPTLFHSIYGGIMGYFITLSKFYLIFRNSFLKKSFLIPFLLHGFFNYFIFTPFNFISAFLLIGALLFLLKWYVDRENFEKVVINNENKKEKIINPPLFTDNLEMQALLFKKPLLLSSLKDFGICLFCFKRLKKDSTSKCSYCRNDTNITK